MDKGGGSLNKGDYNLVDPRMQLNNIVIKF